MRHLLVPIASLEEVDSAVRYARLLAERHITVRITLLSIEPETSGAPASSGSSIAVNACDLSSITLQAAVARVQAADVPCCLLIRSGERVFTILDVAEQLNCQEIVVSAAKPAFILGAMSSGCLDRLLRAQRSIPVILIENTGTAGAGSARAASPEAGQAPDHDDGAEAPTPTARVSPLPRWLASLRNWFSPRSPRPAGAALERS
ncbi:MAG: universal stress protein [Rhodocyclaceae bacterium]